MLACDAAAAAAARPLDSYMLSNTENTAIYSIGLCNYRPFSFVMLGILLHLQMMLLRFLYRYRNCISFKFRFIAL